MPSIDDLARQASLVFAGTVTELGASTVPLLPASEKLVVVRVDRGLRVDPVLGDLRGKLITVDATAPRTLKVGQHAIFFTRSWIHGRGLAVHEVAHVDPGQEQETATAIARLPEQHLKERVESAELRVAAQVTHIGAARKSRQRRNAAFWAPADLRVDRVILGSRRQTTTVFFPTTQRPPWTNAPKLKEGQSGIFILHPVSRPSSAFFSDLDPGSLIVLDPDDFQADSQLSKVESLVAAVRRERGNR